jgi:hypothetical protein
LVGSSFGGFTGGGSVGGTAVSAGFGVRVGTVRFWACESAAHALGPARLAAATKTNMMSRPKMIQRRMLLRLLTAS